jgi:hypothetical protein
MLDGVSLQVVFALLGKITAAVIAVGATAWTAFHFLPKQWLQHKFDEQLERLRADHARELQEARHRLDVILRQTSKLHEKEFDVFAEAWEKLNEALGHVASLLSVMQSYPDLSKMSDDRFRAFVASCSLDEVDRKELLAAKDRSSYYEQRIFWYRLRDAKAACRGFHRAIQSNSIFLEPQIRERFLKIDEAMWSALISREIGQEVADMKVWLEASQKLRDQTTPLKDEIQRLVQKRLGYDVSGS